MVLHFSTTPTRMAPWSGSVAINAASPTASLSHRRASRAGFTIAIPHFNTTLSRVDRLEVAAVIEVLLALRHCPPRNVSAAIAARLREDVVAFVQNLELQVRAGRGAGPTSFSSFPGSFLGCDMVQGLLGRGVSLVAL